MNIYEVHKKLVIDHSPISLHKTTEVIYKCPYCEKHLITYCLTEEGAESFHEQKCLYNDGDTIDTPEEYWKKLDTELMVGECDACGNQIKEIHFDLLDQKIPYEFIVQDPDHLIKNFEELTLYELMTGNKRIGHIFQYNHGEIEKEALIVDDESCKNFTRPPENYIRNKVYRVDLECLTDLVNVKVKNIGVCNGHYEGDEQKSIWEMSSEIVLYLVDNLEKIT